MNANIEALSNGDFHVVVEDGLMIITEQDDPLYAALVDAMIEGSTEGQIGVA